MPFCKKSIELYREGYKNNFFKHNFFSLGNYYIFVDSVKARDMFSNFYRSLSFCITNYDHNSYNYIIAKSIYNYMISLTPEQSKLLKTRIEDIELKYKAKKLKTFNIIFDEFFFNKHILKLKPLIEEKNIEDILNSVKANEKYLDSYIKNTAKNIDDAFILSILEDI